MGNSAGKENDINNLMHVTIVKDADLPKAEVAQNNASVWKIINERYWELEMNQFKGFEEFNFFRAINPGFHVGTAEKRPGIVVGDQESFQGYKELYDFCYTDTYKEDKEEVEEGDRNADQAEEVEDVTPPVPETRLLNINANNLPNVEDVTALKRMYLKAERNIVGLPLLPGVNSVEQLQEIMDVLVTACKSFEGLLEITEGNTFKLDEVKSKKLNDLSEKGLAKKPDDPYLKCAGVARWWPQGRVVAYGIDPGFHVIINQYEHLKLEWTIQQGAYVSSFHKFFKALNSFHKLLKRKQLGGFWKDPKYGYISVDPAKFGTMFSCELDFTVHAIPMYFSKEEIVEECDSCLGIIIIPLDTRNTYTMRVKEPQWMNEVEQLGLLLNSVNRLAQIDRSLYFSPRNAGDTLFNLASLKS
ncbi:hypothetical protein ACHWQZ_G008595 [Mnemiopsis leidyi]